jgi:hypothetical protein
MTMGVRAGACIRVRTNDARRCNSCTNLLAREPLHRGEQRRAAIHRCDGALKDDVVARDAVHGASEQVQAVPREAARVARVRVAAAQLARCTATRHSKHRASATVAAWSAVALAA